ncbi:transporter substrate-binding domain-containing protein, partial [Xanthovirga aplysinae]|uniref:transporter substrate-binding domain-containing protein n=1 Tax=Xanthovirga aplysinae TaxID=2529853 RepID=UPI0012BD6E1C
MWKFFLLCTGFQFGLVLNLKAQDSEQRVGAIEKRRPLTVALNKYEIPLSFEENGQIKGFYVDLLNAIGKETGLKFKIVLKEWAEIYEQFTQYSSFDLTTLYYSKERATKFEYSTTLLIIDHVFISRKGSFLMGLPSLRDQRILVEKKSLVSQRLLEQYPDLRLVEVPSESYALQEVSKGKYDLAIVDEFQAQRLDLIPDYKGLKVIGADILPMEQCFAVHKGDTALLARINFGLERIKRKGI